MKHDYAEEAFRLGQLSARQPDHGLLFLPVGELAGSADGFHLCTDLIDLVERGKSKITATADPARPHALAVRPSVRGGLEFRVFYVEPQQISYHSDSDDGTMPAVIGGDARTRTAPLEPAVEVTLSQSGHSQTRVASAPTDAGDPQAASPGDGAATGTPAPHLRPDVSHAQSQDDAVPPPPSAPPTETEGSIEQPGTSGDLFQSKDATVLALRDARDTRIAHKLLRAAKAGRLKWYEEFIKPLAKAHNALRVRALLTATYEEGHVTTDRLGPLDWSGLDGITKALPLEHAMFIRGRIGPIGAPGSLQCRLQVEALLTREHDEVVKSLVHNGILKCALLDREVGLKIAPLWDRGCLRMKLGVERMLTPHARFEVTLEDAYLEQCDDERRNALAHELAEKVRRAPPPEPEWTRVDPWSGDGSVANETH